MIPAAVEAREAPSECAPDTARTSPLKTDLPKQVVSDVKLFSRSSWLVAPQTPPRATVRRSSPLKAAPTTPKATTIRRSSPTRAALTTPKATIRRSSPPRGFSLRRSCSFDSLPKRDGGNVASQQDVGVHTDAGDVFAVRVPALSTLMLPGVKAPEASPECGSPCALDAARTWLHITDLSKQVIDRDDKAPSPPPNSLRAVRRSSSFDRLLLRKKVETPTSDAPVLPSPKVAGTTMRRSLSFGSLPQRRSSSIQHEPRAEVSQLLITGELKVLRGRRRITTALSLCRLARGGHELRSAHALPCFMGKGGTETSYELPWSSVTACRSTDSKHEFELVYEVINRGGKAVTGLPTIAEHTVTLYAGGSVEFEKWRRAFVELQKEARLQKLREAGGRIKKGFAFSEARLRAAEAARRAALKKDAEELTIISQQPAGKQQPSSKQLDLLQYLVAGGQYGNFIASSVQASAV